MTPELATYAALLVGFVGGGLYFSAVEATFATLSHRQPFHTKQASGMLPRLIAYFQLHPNYLYATTLLGSLCCLICVAGLMARGLATMHLSETVVTLVLLITLPLIVFCAELLPRTALHLRNERILRTLVLPAWGLSWLLFPLVRPIAHLMGANYRPNGFLLGIMTKEHIAALLTKENNEVEPLERRMIKRILDFSHKEVEDVMIPLAEVCAFEKHTPLALAIKEIKKKGYSRYPAYFQRIDNIIGIVHAKDLLDATMDQPDISEEVRSASYIPKNQKVSDLLAELQAGHSNMAVVVDEYGGAIGICTIEDIIEEIVGDIEDEYDEDEDDIVKIGPKSYRINARIAVEKLNDRLGLKLPSGDYDTLGGFLLDRLRRIPRKGDTVRYRKISFAVKEGTKRSIEEVILTLE